LNDNINAAALVVHVCTSDNNTQRTELRLLESQAVVQMRAECDTDDVSNLCSFRNAPAARSPIMTQGAMVLPVVTRGMMDPSAIRSFSIP
jgi:hypothetical protein